MIRHALPLLSVAGLLFACSPEPPRVDAEADVWSGRVWSLETLNGEYVLRKPARSAVFVTRTGDTIWFEAGCGFSLSIHQPEPVVRDPQRISHPCSAVDLERLGAVEAIMREGGSISANDDEIVISSADGRKAVFKEQATWNPSE